LSEKATGSVESVQTFLKSDELEAALNGVRATPPAAERTEIEDCWKTIRFNVEKEMVAVRLQLLTGSAYIRNNSASGAFRFSLDWWYTPDFKKIMSAAFSELREIGSKQQSFISRPAPEWALLRCRWLLLDEITNARGTIWEVATDKDTKTVNEDLAQQLLQVYRENAVTPPAEALQHLAEAAHVEHLKTFPLVPLTLHTNGGAEERRARLRQIIESHGCPIGFDVHQASLLTGVSEKTIYDDQQTFPRVGRSRPVQISTDALRKLLSAQPRTE
jgi:hypothetical protein